MAMKKMQLDKVTFLSAFLCLAKRCAVKKEETPLNTNIAFGNYLACQARL